MGQIKIPEAFQEMCDGWHVDMHLVVSNDEELADELLIGQSKAAKLEIKEFLDKLLDSDYSTAEIKGVWRRCLRDVSGFGRAKDAYKFTKILRKKIE